MALKLFGMEMIIYDGLPTKKKLEMLTHERGLPRGLHNFINDMKLYSNCKPRFYHEYALSKLKNEGYNMAVCSNSIRGDDAKSFTRTIS